MRSTRRPDDSSTVEASHDLNAALLSSTRLEVAVGQVAAQLVPIEYQGAVASIGAAAMADALDRGTSVITAAKVAWPLGQRRRFVVDLLRVRQEEGGDLRLVAADLELLSHHFQARSTSEILGTFRQASPEDLAARLFEATGALGARASLRGWERRVFEAMNVPQHDPPTILLRLWTLRSFGELIPRLEPQPPPDLIHEAIIVTSTAAMSALAGDEQSLIRLYKALIPWQERARIAFERFTYAFRQADPTAAARDLLTEWSRIDERLGQIPSQNLAGELRAARVAGHQGGSGNHGRFRIFAEIVVRNHALEFDQREGETLEVAARRLMRALRKKAPPWFDVLVEKNSARTRGTVRAAGATKAST